MVVTGLGTPLVGGAAAYFIWQKWEAVKGALLRDPFYILLGEQLRV